jgi:hypothetical protein
MSQRKLHRRELTTQIYSVLLLSGLLLVLCASARLARYDLQHRSLRLATNQAFVEGNEGLRRLPKSAPPLVWQALVVAVFAVATFQLISFTVFAPVPVPLRRSGPMQYSRPPPIS